MKSSYVIHLTIFITFVICGYWVGTNLHGDNHIFSKGYTIPLAIEQSPINNGQQNVLVVTVTQQDDTNAELVSAWLVTYFTDNPSVTFYPVFPTFHNRELVSDKVLQDAYQTNSVNGKNELSSAFLKELAERNIEWNKYLLIDHRAISELLDDTQVTSSSGILINSRNQVISSSQNNTIASYMQEILALQVICNQLEKNDFMVFWEAFQGSATKYMSSDNNIDLIFEEWEAILTHSKSPICILPLNALSPMGDS